MPGINTIVSRIKETSSTVNSELYFEYDSELPIKNIAMPDENLSRSEYIPKTKAPVFALAPTTSDIKLIPVDKTRDWDTP